MKKDIVKQLKRLKEHYGVSYSFIADKIGVTPLVLNRYMAEENRNLSDESLVKLLNIIKKYNKIKL